MAFERYMVIAIRLLLRNADNSVPPRLSQWSAPALNAFAYKTPIAQVDAFVRNSECNRFSGLGK